LSACPARGVLNPSGASGITRVEPAAHSTVSGAVQVHFQLVPPSGASALLFRFLQLYNPFMPERRSPEWIPPVIERVLDHTLARTPAARLADKPAIVRIALVAFGTAVAMMLARSKGKRPRDSRQADRATLRHASPRKGLPAHLAIE